MTKIKNFTPHPVTVVGADGKTILATFQPEGLIRLKSSTVAAGEACGVPLTKTVFGEPEGLPEFVQDTLLIVSQLVKSALPQRTDLVVPAEVCRDNSGNIVGCKSLGL